MKDTAKHQNQQTPQNEERTKNTMKTNITRRFLQATLGAVLATGIVVSGCREKSPGDVRLHCVLRPFLVLRCLLVLVLRCVFHGPSCSLPCAGYRG